MTMECGRPVRLLVLVAVWFSCSLATKKCPATGEYYSPQSDSCVTECPCGMDEDTDSSICIQSDVFIRNDQEQISASAKSGSGTILRSIAININDKVITKTSSLKVRASVNMYKSSYNSHGYDYVQPTFQLTANNTSSEIVNNSIIFDGSTLTKLPVQCTRGSQDNYRLLKLNLVLTSNSIYHLGELQVHILGSVHNSQIHNSRSDLTFYKYLYFTVQSECHNSSLLYDFAAQKCVSQCSCGHAAIQYYMFGAGISAYCGAVNYFKPAQFFDDQSKLKISHNVNGPPTTITTNIRMYVNFSEVDRFIRNYGNGQSTVFAHLNVSVTYYYRNFLPLASLTAPDGTESMTIKILLNNESRYIEHCYDSLLNHNHTYINVPMTIHSPPKDTWIDRLNCIVTLDLISPDSTRSIPSYYRDTYRVTVSVNRIYPYYGGSRHGLSAHGVKILAATLGTVGGVVVLGILFVTIVIIAVVYVKRFKHLKKISLINGKEYIPLSTSDNKDDYQQVASGMVY